MLTSNDEAIFEVTLRFRREVSFSSDCDFPVEIAEEEEEKATE